MILHPAIGFQVDSVHSMSLVALKPSHTSQQFALPGNVSYPVPELLSQFMPAGKHKPIQTLVLDRPSHQLRMLRWRHADHRHLRDPILDECGAYSVLGLPEIDSFPPTWREAIERTVGCR